MKDPRRNEQEIISPNGGLAFREQVTRSTARSHDKRVPRMSMKRDMLSRRAQVIACREDVKLESGDVDRPCPADNLIDLLLHTHRYHGNGSRRLRQ